MKGFHDLLRQKPSSLLMLLGWGSISVTYPMAYSDTEDGGAVLLQDMCNLLPGYTEPYSRRY
jgi:hypothetical protein